MVPDELQQLPAHRFADAQLLAGEDIPHIPPKWDATRRSARVW
jgi:hypothetical protein